MRRLLPLTPYVLVAPGMRFVSLALIACAASITLLAQTEIRIAAQDQSVHAILPADPAPAAAVSFAVPNLGKPTTGLASAAFDFGQPRLQPFALPKGASDNSPQWNRSMLDPFQPGPNFGKFSHSTDSSNRFGGTGMRGRQDNLGSFSQIGGSGRLRRSSGEDSTSSSTQLVLPSFNALMRTNRGQPLSPSLGTFQLSYRELLGPRGDTGDPSLLPGSTLFSSSDLGNGVFFSAGTGSGSRPGAGAAATSLGSATAGGQKHSSPLVNLKLSF